MKLVATNRGTSGLEAFHISLMNVKIRILEFKKCIKKRVGVGRSNQSNWFCKGKNMLFILVCLPMTQNSLLSSKFV